MKTLIPVALTAALMTACVAPIPINTNAIAIQPGYFPIYTPQIARTPMLPSLPAPIAVAANPVRTAITAPIVPRPKTVPVAYNRNIPKASPMPQAKVLNVPVLKPLANKQPVQVQQVPKLTVASPTPKAGVTQINTGQHRTQDLNWLAQRIFQNQTGGNASRLIKWNERENFAALGIGQFIWYPAGKRGRYQETFPAYLNYVKANAVPLPAWLANRPTRGGPWATTSDFQRAQNDQQMQELRNFMQKTLNLQANFMALRLKQTLPQQINQLPADQRQKALRSYQTLSKTPGSLYPLLDYVQFQGNGANTAERYNGKGWGLLQVLQNMEQVQPGPGALAEFMRAADDTLVTRIANAPSDRREARLLNGWLERVNTYRPQRRASR